MPEEVSKEQTKAEKKETIPELTDDQLNEVAGGAPDEVPGLEKDKSEQITKVGRPGLYR